ncbi:MBL fold metallo-hydrolase [Opitutales bacterium ASA1]|nr:MBL fold metallo-hydrolase [Opitutales bacterium ASA1]
MTSAAIVIGCAAWTKDRDGRKRDLLPSGHYDGKRFFNPALPANSLPKFRDAFRMMGDERAKWPAWVENTTTPNLPASVPTNQIALTFVNHATFLIQFDGLNILTDPIWSKRASPVRWAGPKRVRAPGIAFEDLPKIDLILISHNHYDHLDLDTLKRLHKKFAPKILVPIGDRTLVKSAGYKDIVELDWWESVDIEPGVAVTFAPAQHQANRGVFDRQSSLWGSYLVKAGEKKIYFGGDTGYSPHFAEIKARLGSPDLALLGIGSYEPRWFMKGIHMNPAEAVLAHRDLGARHSVGMHYGTFQLSAEPIDQPPKDLLTALTDAGVPEADFITLNEGQTRIYGPRSETSVGIQP